MSGAADGRLHALLVGVDRYLAEPLPSGHSYPSLSGCVRDVERVERFLGELGVPGERIIKLTATLAPGGLPSEPPEARPTRDNLLAALTALRTAAVPGDRAWIHYSGHGGRAPTRYPAAKGSDGLDEGLVPWDIVVPETDYLRDVEISRLLEEMVEAGVFVTLVLDCCHAGGATRGPARDGVAVRGVEFVDTTPRHGDDRVGSPDELAAAWLDRRAPGDGLVRHACLGHSWAVRPRGYVLLAACRPQERAVEMSVGGRCSGALTDSLLQVLEAGGSEPTFEELHARLLAAIHARHLAQTPMLEGEGQRRVFGLERWPVVPGLRVLEVDGDGVRLDGGMIQGLAPRARLAVRPAGGDCGGGPGAEVLVEIVEVEAAASRARLLDGDAASGPVEVADRAVLVDPGPRAHAIRVAVEGPGAGGVEDGYRRMLAEALERGDGSLLEPAPAGEPADLAVEVERSGKIGYRDLTGTPLPNPGPPLRAAAPGAVEATLERLTHLARFRNVRALANPDPDSAVQQGLVAELLALPADFDPQAPGLTLPGDAPAHRLLEVRDGAWALLRVRFEGRDPVNITVLDLQPDWGITQVYPGRTGGSYYPLDPGGTVEVALRASLPPGCAPRPDVLKVFATLESTRFRWLELPALGEPAESVRATPASPLERLLAGTAGVSPPSRRVHRAPAGGHGDWGVTQVELAVR